MTFIGQSGILFMDNDYLCAPDARNTATVLASTAYGEEHHYEAYDVQTSCLFEEDGSRLAWGNDLVIEIDFPNITITGSFRHMTVDLKIVVSEHAAWFSRTPIYDHVCLLSDYQGTIKDMRGITPISGVCSFEYAHAMSLQSLQRQPIPTHLKIPVDFFTYQIVHLDKDTQLLLDKVTAGGTVIDESARLCSRHGGVQVYKDVDFEVLEYKQSRITNPRDRAMRVPSRLCWTVREASGTVLTLSACVDAPLRFGLCRGYVGGYSFTGKWRGKAVKGNGYLEWVNVAD